MLPLSGVAGLQLAPDVTHILSAAEHRVRGFHRDVRNRFSCADGGAGIVVHVRAAAGAASATTIAASATASASASATRCKIAAAAAA
jgi:hypothetical protein